MHWRAYVDLCVSSLLPKFQDKIWHHVQMTFLLENATYVEIKKTLEINIEFKWKLNEVPKLYGIVVLHVNIELEQWTCEMNINRADSTILFICQN